MTDFLKVRVVTLAPIYADSDPTKWTDRSQWKVEMATDVNHEDFKDRKWLGKHCFWAMRNNRIVVTYPYK